MSKSAEPRRYMTHDPDLGEVELVVESAENGDWYVSIVRRGHKIDRLAPLPGEHPTDAPASVVRVTTSGERREHAGVATAIANLWRALGGERTERP